MTVKTYTLIVTTKPHARYCIENHLTLNACQDVELSLWPPEDEDEGVLLEEERSKMLMDLYVTFAGCTLVVLILDLWLPKKVLAAFGFINDRKI